MSPGDEIEAAELAGGVSNIVIGVHSPGFRGVVKQALPRLRVPDEWLAKQERVLNEAASLDVTVRLTPGHVPHIIDVDPDRFVVTIEHAPEGWHTWKEDLLAGHADARVAARLGGILADWHLGTSSPGSVPPQLDDRESFEQLRVDPYYRTVMARVPEMANVVGSHVDRMLATRTCLVHGDFSPKNILVGPAAERTWVIDHEVAHLGDPAFDLAFMLTHLMLKSIHVPTISGDLRACALAFWDSYRTATPAGHDHDAAYVLGHMGCLMLARVEGKSPAEYLLPVERDTARAAGKRLLCEPPDDIEQAWDNLRGAAR